MFQDLNPLDQTTAFLEIGIMLLGAAIIGFVTAWLIGKARKPAVDQSGSEAKYLASLKKNNETIQGLRADVEKAQNDFKVLQKQFNETSQRLKEKAKPALAFSTEIEDIKKRLAEEKAASHDLRQEVARLKAEAAKAKPQPSEPGSNPRVDQLQKEVAALTSQNKELLRRLETDQAEKEDSGRIDRLQRELSSANAQNEELRKKISAQATEAEPDPARVDLERKLKQQTIELVQKTADIASLQNKITSLEMKLGSAPAPGPEQEKQLAKLEKELESRGTTVEKLEKQLKKAEEVAREAATTAAEVPNLKAQLKTLEVENLSLKSKPATSEMPAGQEALTKAEAKIASLEKSLEEAEQKLKAAATAKPSVPSGSGEAEWLRKEKEDQEEEIAELEESIQNMVKDNAQLRARLRDKSGSQTEKQLQELEKERDQLQVELKKLRKAMAATTGDEPGAAPDFSHLGDAATDDKDDLTKIEGIDAEVEQKLNGLGISTIAQLSQLGAGDMAQIEAALGLASGQVKQEKWAKQARKLMK